MSGQSVADFLPVFLQHYSEDIRKSFRVKDIDIGHLNELAASSNPAAKSWMKCWQVALRPAGRLSG